MSMTTTSLGNKRAQAVVASSSKTLSTMLEFGSMVVTASSNAALRADCGLHAITHRISLQYDCMTIKRRVVSEFCLYIGSLPAQRMRENAVGDRN
jgi:hypothetical protein